MPLWTAIRQELQDLKTKLLIVPGYGNSGPSHWQSLWEKQLHGIRLHVSDWQVPNVHEWTSNLQTLIDETGPVIIVAHSMGCLNTAFVAQNPLIKGALLVAPANPHRRGFPAQDPQFKIYPRQALPFPSLVVASSDDPFGTLDFAQGLADDWQAGFANIGNAGHINANSGLGDWIHGIEHLQDLLRQVQSQSQASLSLAH